VMELLRALENLFEAHAPETLMAFFGAGTSILLFYLIWAVLRHFFGLQTRSANQDADQDQATTALLNSLVEALVTEAGHLRGTLDNLLEESLHNGQKTAQDLATLLTRTEETPEEVLRLLKPEFDHLHQEMRQAEARLIAKVTEMAVTPVIEGEGIRTDD
jgi:hypothetical protein